jgi:hypothetical protein
MGVTGIPESGNALAAAVRKLGETLKASLQDAENQAKMGLPVAATVLQAGTVLDEPITAKDPTKAVTAFLGHVESWKMLYQALQALRTFLEANRHREFETSRRMVDLAAHHPVPADHPTRETLVRALQDMDAIITERAVIERWTDYRAAYETARDAYRDAYRNAYETVQREVETTVQTIKNGSAYQAAPVDHRDAVVDTIFGAGGPCSYPEVGLGSAAALLTAAAKHSLTALSQARMALPGYRSQVETTLRDLVVPPQKIWEWRPAVVLGGQCFATEAEVDQTLQTIADQLKVQIRAGYTVVVK